MKSIILSLLILCAIILSVSQGQKAYGIWDDDETGVATVGSIDLNTAKGTPLFSNTGYVFNYGNVTASKTTYNQLVTGISSYNPVSGLITYIATQSSTGVKYLVSVDTYTWTIFNNSKIDSSMKLGNLAYDLTSSEYNLFSTYTLGDGSLYIVKISVSESVVKAIDVIPNVFPNATGTYNSKTQHYVVCYQVNDNSWLQYCNNYNLSDAKVSSVSYLTVNLGSYWHDSSSPWALTYLATQDKLITYLTLNNTSYQPNLKVYEFFWLTSNTFYNSGWTSDFIENQISVFTPFCDASLPRVYQFAKTNFRDAPFGNSLYTYSTYNDQWVRTQPSNVAVLNAWGIA